MIDKIFNDFDYGPQILEDAKKLFEYWTVELGHKAVPLVSGRKGYHIYLMFKPKLYGPKTKILLTKATYSILTEVFGIIKEEKSLERNKRVTVLRNDERIIGPDPKVIGDVRRLGRLPNTLRPPKNNNYCTYLDPDEFLDMTERDVLDHAKSIHTYDFEFNSRDGPFLTDFEYEFPETDIVDWTPLSQNVNIPSEPNLFLKNLLRPCLYKNITTIHPEHQVRVATTVDLLRAGYNTEFILNIYSTLGWEDFDAEKTFYQINSCKTYTSYSCKKLRNLKVPEVCCIG